MNCNHNCRCGNQICRWAIYSQSVQVINIDGVDTLVIDIPLSAYPDGYRYCLYVIQDIPASATRYMPVAISIGGNTTKVYPLTRCNCTQITQCAIRNRHWYRVMVATDGTNGAFKVVKGLSCSPDNSAASLPIGGPSITTAREASAVLRAAAAVKKNTGGEAQ